MIRFTITKYGSQFKKSLYLSWYASLLTHARVQRLRISFIKLATERRIWALLKTISERIRSLSERIFSQSFSRSSYEFRIGCNWWIRMLYFKKTLRPLSQRWSSFSLKAFWLSKGTQNGYHKSENALFCNSHLKVNHQSSNALRDFWINQVILFQ